MLFPGLTCLSRILGFLFIRGVEHAAVYIQEASHMTNTPFPVTLLLYYTTTTLQLLECAYKPFNNISPKYFNLLFSFISPFNKTKFIIDLNLIY
jgi:hypothetical protein